MVTTDANMKRQTFTTGVIAKGFQVAPRTISKWIDAGRLKGYRLPGSADRRVNRDEVIRFASEHGLPIGWLGEVDQSDSPAKIDSTRTLKDAINNLTAFTSGESYDSSSLVSDVKMVCVSLQTLRLGVKD